MSIRSGLFTCMLAIVGACGADKITGVPAVASVELSARADTMTALGEVRQLSAIAKDASGAAIAGKTITWTTSAPNIVALDPRTGTVTAVANGQATISAQVDGFGATALFTVAQAVATVSVTPGTSNATTLGSTQQFTATTKDANGNAVVNAPIVWLSSNSAVATMDVSGLATTTGAGVATITALAQGIPGTAALTVVQTATQLAITVQPASSIAGQALSSAVQVEIRDASGARVVLARDAVTLAVGANPGSATLAGTKTVSAIAGVATFTGLALDKAGTGYTLSASSGALTAATSAAFDIGTGPAARLAFTRQPTGGMAGAVITPAVQVAVQDAFGNMVSNAATPITVALSNNLGGATLAGTATQTAVSGVATFSDLALGGGGSEYTLTASAPGLPPASSAAFAVMAAPSVSRFTAAHRTITSGTDVTLTPVFANGTATIDHGVGTVTSGVPVATGVLTTTTTFTLSVANALGAVTTSAVTVTVVSAPTITSLTAAQSTVTTGTGTSLTAVFAGGTATIDNGVGSVTSGAFVSTGPVAAATTFTLTVTNAAGATATATVPVAVVSVPTIVGFETSNGSGVVTITSGTSTNLTPIFAGGTGSIDNGLGAVSTGTPMATGVLTATRIFKLTVTNVGAVSVSAVVTVIVVPPPVITSYTGPTSPVTSGTTASLTPTFSGGTGTIDHGVGAVANGSPVTVTPTATGSTSYTLTVTNAAGTAVTASVSLNVIAAPAIASFTATQTTVTNGSTTNLIATFSGGTATIAGVGQVASGIPVQSGPITGSQTFFLTVTSAAGVSVAATLAVTAVPPPFITQYDIRPATGPGAAGPFLTATVGASAILTTSFTGGTGTIDHGIGPVLNNVGIVTPLSEGTTSYTLTVTNAAGATASAQVVAQVVPPPTISSFTADRSTVSFGEQVVLTPAFSGGEATIDHGIGPVLTGVHASSVGLTTSTTFTLTVSNAAGLTATATVSVAVVPIPTISNFFAQSSTMTSGASNSLVPIFAGGTATIDHGVGLVTSGIPVAPTFPVGMTVYTLTVTNAAGYSVTATTPVTVYTAPTIGTFSAAQRTITAGASTNLNVSFAGGTGTINGGLPLTSGLPFSTGPLFGTTIYLLTVINPLGAIATDTLTVTVVNPPTIQTFTAGPATMTAGSGATISALFSDGVGTVDHGVGVVNSGMLTTTGAPIVGTTVFTLTVTNAAGTAVTATASVIVVPPPVIAGFAATQLTVTSGGSALLTPFFSGGTAFVDNGIGSVVNGGGFSTGPLTATTTFTLLVVNDAGTIVTRAVTVTVVPPPSIAGFISAAGSITSGTGTTLTAVFTGGTATISGIGPVTSGTPVSTGNLTGSQAFLLTVTNAAGTSVTATVQVTVIDAPTITIFVANPNSISSGQSTFVGATFGGGTAIVDHGVGPITTNTNFPTGVLTATTIFTLTVTNALGATATATVTVTVTPSGS